MYILPCGVPEFLTCMALAAVVGTVACWLIRGPADEDQTQ